jgi:DNA-binding MarR family transcriptional regulator
LAPDAHAYDPVLLSPVRLGIVTVLLERGDTAFSDLKTVLRLTQGNLGVHLRKLEDAGYVRVDKDFVERKPRTTAVLTGAGRKAFLDHVKRLQNAAKNAAANGR